MNVPDDAKIFVNGQPTTSTGSLRQYVSRSLKNGFNYSYEVRAEIVRDGKPVEQVKTINVRAGETATLAFDFPASGFGRDLADGSRARRCEGLSGRQRHEGHRRDPHLPHDRPEQRQDVGGLHGPRRAGARRPRSITKEETISLKAGESREIRFDFEGDKVASNR